MNKIGNSNKRNTYTINFYIMCYYYRRNKIESPAYSLLHDFSFLSYSKCCSAGIFRQKLDFEAMCE